MDYSLKESRRSGRPVTLPTGVGPQGLVSVLAIDPGITTGLTYAEVFENIVFLRCWQDKLRHLDLWMLFVTHDPNWIICETFEYRNRAREGLELFPRELIGICNLWVQDRKIEDKLYMQTAAQAKGHFTDQQLKKYSVYSNKVHGRDSMRHFLHWFTFGPGYQYNKRQKMELT